MPWIKDRQSQEVFGPGKDGAVNLAEQPKYTWSPWETVKYTENLKSGYYALKKFYESLPEHQPE